MSTISDKEIVITAKAIYGANHILKKEKKKRGRKRDRENGFDGGVLRGRNASACGLVVVYVRASPSRSPYVDPGVDGRTRVDLRACLSDTPFIRDVWLL